MEKIQDDKSNKDIPSFTQLKYIKCPSRYFCEIIDGKIIVRRGSSSNDLNVFLFTDVEKYLKEIMNLFNAVNEKYLSLNSNKKGFLIPEVKIKRCKLVKAIDEKDENVEYYDGIMNIKASLNVVRVELVENGSFVDCETFAKDILCLKELFRNEDFQNTYISMLNEEKPGIKVSYCNSGDVITSDMLRLN